MLTSLPDEIIEQILAKLEVNDLIRVRLTSSILSFFSNSKQLWIGLLKRDFSFDYRQFLENVDNELPQNSAEQLYRFFVLWTAFQNNITTIDSQANSISQNCCEKIYDMAKDNFAIANLILCDMFQIQEKLKILNHQRVFFLIKEHIGSFKTLDLSAPMFCRSGPDGDYFIREFIKLYGVGKKSLTKLILPVLDLRVYEQCFNALIFKKQIDLQTLVIRCPGSEIENFKTHSALKSFIANKKSLKQVIIQAIDKPACETYLLGNKNSFSTRSDNNNNNDDNNNNNNNNSNNKRRKICST